ncbi:MAG TPA: DUF6265 family protein [Planctomycetota bacterium]|nr:DUF6265 family protein [Planctomycetota bacterium]
MMSWGLRGLVMGLVVVGVAGAQEQAAKSLGDFVGHWVYVEDRTPDLEKENRGPNHRGAFQIRLDEKSVYLEWQSPGNVVQINLDGSDSERVDQEVSLRSRGGIKEGILTTHYVLSRPDGKGERKHSAQTQTYILVPEGLLVHLEVTAPSQWNRVCLYQQRERIPLPQGVTAKIQDVGWLGTNWAGNMGKATIEERWGPAQGGAMLGVARTISGEKMTSFEFLRIIERDEGLVYVAQPGGGAATEFVLTELSETRAVFENPRHDFPQRIVYERIGADGLRTEISFTGGDRPQRFDYKREVR